MKKNDPLNSKSFHRRTHQFGVPTNHVQAVAPPCGDETLDTLFGGELKLYQGRRGYRFSLDSILLSHFATIRPGEKLMDLGTGNGVIPVILARLHPAISITGLEIQQPMTNRAARNIRLNGYENRVTVTCMDVCAAVDHFMPESFDVVICNPPYRRPHSGRLSPSSEKQIARHEVKGTLDDFIRVAAFLLTMKGRFACIHLAGRSVDLLTAMRSAGIEPKRLKMVHSFADAGASTVLVEGAKGGRTGLEVLPPLVVYDGAKAYTAQLDAILSGSRSSI